MPTPPVPNFRFRVLWDGEPLTRVQKVSGLKRTVAVSEHRDGSAPGETTKAPGHVTYEPITLERIVTGDGRFASLADQVAKSAAGVPFRGTLSIEIQDETGSVALRCTLRRAWVSSYEVFVELDAQADQPAIERIVVEYDAWELELQG
jgi:phage tail-like protein